MPWAWKNFCTSTHRTKSSGKLGVQSLIFQTPSCFGAASGYFVARWYFSALRDRIELLKERIWELEGKTVSKPEVKAEAVSAKSFP
jgi:hypothetical protein